MDNKVYYDVYCKHDIWQEPVYTTNMFGKFRRFIYKHKLPMLVITFIISFVSWFFIILQLSENSTQVSNYSNLLDNVQNNLLAFPILNLTMISSNSNSGCPTNTSLIQLGSWPGNQYGCESIWDGEFYYPRKNKGCSLLDTTVYSNSPIQYYSWRNVSFCAQYATNFITNILDCPSGYKSCYFGSCFPENGQCPITNISLTLGPNSTNITKINLIHDGISPPMLKLSVSIGGLPCLDNSTSPSAPQYPLLNTPPTSSGCQAIDPSANTTVDQYGEFNFMVDNGMQNTINSLADYQKYINNVSSNLVLMQQYPTVNNSICLNMQLSTFDIVIMNLENYYSLLSYFEIAGIVLCFLLACAVALKYLLRLKESDIIAKRNSFGYHYTLVTLLTIAIYGQAILLWIIMFKYVEFKENQPQNMAYIYDILNANCLPSIISTAIQQIDNQVYSIGQNLYDTSYYSSIFFFIYMPFITIYLIFYFKKKESYNKDIQNCPQQFDRNHGLTHYQLAEESRNL